METDTSSLIPAANVAGAAIRGRSTMLHVPRSLLEYLLAISCTVERSEVESVIAPWAERLGNDSLALKRHRRCGVVGPLDSRVSRSSSLLISPLRGQTSDDC